MLSPTFDKSNGKETASAWTVPLTVHASKPTLKKLGVE
jgi:hypothetical protein